MIKFVFLSENKTDRPDCDAEHGLSIYIETEEMKIIFDTGASNLFGKIAKRKHVDLEKVDALVLSHGHYDHTGGVPYFCEKNSKAPIYLHKNAMGNFYGSHKGVIDKLPCGIPWTEEEKKNIQPRLHLTDKEPLWLTKRIVISGTIPDVEGNIPTEKFFVKMKLPLEDGFVPDDMSHEEFLAIDTGEKGIFIFSACTHKGIIPVIEYTKKLFPGRPIGAIIAGLHLFASSNKTREIVIDKILETNLAMVMPVHCTGMEAILMLKEKLGDKCIIATVGDSYEYI